MTVRSEPAVSQYGISGDASFLMWDERFAAEKRRCIVVPHGNHGAASDSGPGQAGAFFELIRHLCEHGFTCYAIDAGGASTHANQTSIDAMHAAVTYLGTRFGAQLSGVAALAPSMASGITLNEIKQHPSDLLGAALLSAITDYDFHYYAAGSYTPDYTETVCTQGLYTSELNTAYSCTSGTWPTASAGHRIHDERTTWRGKCPIRIWHGDADNVAPYAAAVKFVNDVADPNVTLRTLSGKGHVPFFAVRFGEYTDFFRSLAWT